VEIESTRIRVKVCGITNLKDALAAVAAGADALGFVFHEASPRYVTPWKVADIVEILPPFVAAVGIFVNRPRQQVEEIAERSGIHVIQLHGDESPEQCLDYRWPVVKAFRFGPEHRLPALEHYRVSGVLIDAVVPGKWGGGGVTLDWELLGQILKSLPSDFRSRLVLAGGLTAENVKQAVKLIRPFAVDVSTGVEESPGNKSARLVKEFIDALRTEAYYGGVA